LVHKVINSNRDFYLDEWFLFQFQVLSFLLF
jgi:hypothetical protein